MNLSDGGFLVDPEGEYAKWSRSDVVPFESIAAKPCLALLGEPGIGKSHAMQDLRKALEESIKDSTDEILWLNLNEYGEESRLIRDLFECNEFLAWRQGHHVLHILLDSLDECCIRIPQVGTILVNTLEQLKGHVARLRLLIACRTADWPATLDQSLPHLWVEDSLEAYELAPLRRKDVEDAASTEGIDTAKFLEELNRTETVPLAIKPITLLFLLSAFKAHDRLPKTRTELYEAGCRLLCEEASLNRQDLKAIGGTGHLSTDQRMVIASRIAAVSLLCRKPTIHTGTSLQVLPEEDVPISELTGGREILNGVHLPVMEDHIREVLGTGLFSSRGASRMGFAHQTYAEFLAARYLDLCDLPSRKLLAVLRHQGDPEGHVVPQLSETAAWLAASNREVLAALVRDDPQVLLGADAAALSEDDRSLIVGSLLDALQNGRANHSDWDLHRQHAKLQHPGLAEQLRPWINDKNHDITARDAAIDIAIACKVHKLQGVLADVALDQTETERIRDGATRAVAAIGDAETRKRLLPLALGQAGEDSYDQLKGNALSGLWPDLMTVEELFQNLTQPKRQSLHGAYRDFLDELASHLKPEDLSVAVRWVGSSVVGLDFLHAFSTLAERIFACVWGYLDAPGVLDALADTYVQLLQGHANLLYHQHPESWQTFTDAGKRHRLVEAVLGKIHEDAITASLMWEWPRLARPEDLGWSVEKLLASVGGPTEQAWAELTWCLVNPEQCGSIGLDLLLDTRTKSQAFRQVSDALFTPVDLDSDEANMLKDRYQKFQGMQHKRKSELLEPPPEEHIQFFLNKSEQGQHDAWCRLIGEMTLEETSTKYENPFETLDVRDLPGWRNLDEPTRKRILVAGEKCLRLKTPYDQAHLLNGSGSKDDAAVIKAFALLLNLCPDKITDLPDDVWAHWVPVILGPFGYGDTKATMQTLIGIAYQRVPDRVIEAFRGVLRHRMAKDDRLFLPDALEALWDERIADCLFGLLPEAQAKPVLWGGLLGVLASHGHQRAFDLAGNRLATPLPETEVERSLAREAALILIRNTPTASWSLVWPAIEQDQPLGRDIVCELAYDLHHHFEALTPKLNAMQLAELFLWLVQEYPYATDPDHDGADFVTKEDAVRELRNALVNILAESGTSSSCQALQHIADVRPDLTWLKSVLVEARQNTLRQTWRPLKPADLLALVSRSRAFLVRDATELQEALVEVLMALETILKGKPPAAHDLWDQVDRRRGKERFHPKNEGHFADWVKRHLEAELKARGIVADREVQISRRERTDIHVTAVVPGVVEGQFDQVCAIIEVKGCWHPELKEAMMTQLVERYLKDNPCRNGIYLVGWFTCDQWDRKDSRRKNTPHWSLPEARLYFDTQARELSIGDLSIRAVVIDAAL